jgi:hypothetical protein
LAFDLFKALSRRVRKAHARGTPWNPSFETQTPGTAHPD